MSTALPVQGGVATPLASTCTELTPQRNDLVIYYGGDICRHDFVGLFERQVAARPERPHAGDLFAARHSDRDMEWPGWIEPPDGRSHGVGVRIVENMEGASGLCLPGKKLEEPRAVHCCGARLIFDQP